MRRTMTRMVGLVLLAAAPHVAGQTEDAVPPAPPATPSVAAVEDAGDAEREARQAIAALRAEIDALLTPAGLPRQDDQGTDASSKRQLESVASRSRQLAAMNADAPQMQYAAQQLELRAYNALAQEATLGDRPVEASYRLTQLRNAATEAKRNRYEPADATGDFWLLVADLIDINRNAPDLVAAQRDAAARLETYLARYGEDPAAPRSLLIDVKSSLVRLHDQAGRNAQAQTLLDELRAALPEDDPRLLALGDVAQRCALLGEPVNLSVQTIEGKPWSVEQQRGRTVLLHFYAEGAADTDALFDALRARHSSADAEPISILSIAIDSTSRSAQEQPWPLAVMDAEALDALRRWGVTDLPRLLVLDHEGRLTASSRTASVLYSSHPAPDKSTDGE